MYRVRLAPASSSSSSSSKQTHQATALFDAAAVVIPGMSGTQAKQRRIRAHKVPADHGNPKERLRVLSYDMLAQSNASSANFPRSQESLLSWSFRSQNMLLEVKSADADVVCLQEVSQYTEFWRKSIRGYQGVYQAYPDANAAKGVSILTHPRKMQMREAVQIKFTDDDQAVRSVGVIGLYEGAGSKTFFVVASVSLSNYGDEEKQLEQAGILVHAVSRSRNKLTKDAPRGSVVNVILCGNWNMVPGSMVYQYMTGVLPAETRGDRAGDNRLQLRSAFGRYNGGKEPNFTTATHAWTGTTDFVFYSSSNVAIDGLQEFPSRELIGDGGLPNADFSSNHLSLLVDFLV